MYDILVISLTFIRKNSLPLYLKGTIINDKSNVCKNNGQFNFMMCLYKKYGVVYLHVLMFSGTSATENLENFGIAFSVLEFHLIPF